MGSVSPTIKPNVWRLYVNDGKDPATGKRVQRTKIFHGGKRAAREAMEAWQSELRAAAAPVASRATYADLHEKWIAHERGTGQAGNTLRQKHSIFTLYLEPNIGDHPLADLTVEHLDDLYHRLLTTPGAKGEPLGRSYVKQVHTQLKSTLDKGVAWGWLPANPARLTKAPRTPLPKVTSPSTEAVQALLAEVEVNGKPMLHLFVELVATTGMRPGEACAVTWDRIDFQTGELVVDRSISRYEPGMVKGTKTGNMRRIHLPDELLGQFMQAWPKGHTAAGYVFNLDGHGRQPWRPDQTSGDVRAHARACGHPEVTLRSLRHYVATQLISSGVDPVTVARILGHASPAMTLNIYAAFVPLRGQAALTALRASRMLPGSAEVDPWDEYGFCEECQAHKDDGHAWSCGKAAS